MRKPRLIGSERCGLERHYRDNGYEDDGDHWRARLAQGALSFAHWARIHITPQLIPAVPVGTCSWNAAAQWTAASADANGAAACTALPPTTVSSTRTAATCCGGISKTLRSSTMKSAGLRTSSDPTSCSACSSYAEPLVIARMAAGSVSPGSVLSRPAYFAPAAGSFSRVTATLSANHSLSGSTGQSLP